MQWSDLPLNPSRRMLRQFAVLWIVFFGGLALWHGVLTERTTTSLVLAALAVTFGPLGLVAPAVLRPVFVAWTMLAFPIGWVVSRVLLLLMFVLVMCPVAVFFRLTGRDLLQRRRPVGVESYWKPKASPAGAASYFRQY